MALPYDPNKTYRATAGPRNPSYARGSSVSAPGVSGLNIWEYLHPGLDPTTGQPTNAPVDATAGVHRMPGSTIGRAPTAPPAGTTTPTTPPSASTPPPGNTTQPNPNSSLLAALQTVIDSLGNYAPTQNPTDPLGVSPDYSFNANTSPNQDWSAYVNMLGYNRV